MPSSPLNKQEEIKMSHENQFSEIASIYESLKHQLKRVKAIDDRVEKLEQQALNKDQLIEILSNENKRLKKEASNYLGTIEDLTELSDDLSGQVENLSDEVEELTESLQRFKQGQQSLDKDRSIELLSGENERMKEEIEQLLIQRCPYCDTVFDAWIKI